jgi:hypothetical protein
MTVRLNAMSAIIKEFRDRDWRVVVNNHPRRPGPTLTLQRTFWEVRVQFRLFGAVNNYLCRYYGKDPESGINWGVESASLWTLDPEDTVGWVKHHDFVGKNKKGQLITFAREMSGHR